MWCVCCQCLLEDHRNHQLDFTQTKWNTAEVLPYISQLGFKAKWRPNLWRSGASWGVRSVRHSVLHSLNILSVWVLEGNAMMTYLVMRTYFYTLKLTNGNISWETECQETLCFLPFTLWRNLRPTLELHVMNMLVSQGLHNITPNVRAVGIAHLHLHSPQILHRVAVCFNHSTFNA